MKAMAGSGLVRLITVLLNVGWAAGIGLLVLSVGLLMVSPWVDPPRIEAQLAFPVAITLNPETHHVAAATLGVDDAPIRNAYANLLFSPRSSTVVAGWTLVLIGALVLSLWVIAQLRGVFSTLRQGKPFAAANASRIRRIGWAFLLGEVGRLAFTLVASRYAMTHFTADGLRLGYRLDFDVFAIVTGLIVLVIAEVFAEATRLADEQSLTV